MLWMYDCGAGERAAMTESKRQPERCGTALKEEERQMLGLE